MKLKDLLPFKLKNLLPFKLNDLFPFKLNDLLPFSYKELHTLYAVKEEIGRGGFGLFMLQRGKVMEWGLP